MGNSAKLATVSISPSEKQEQTRRARIVEEHGDLARRKAEAEVRITKELGCRPDRLKELEQEIAGWFRESDPNGCAVIESPTYLAEIGPREFERPVTLEVKKAFFKQAKKTYKDPLDAFDVTLKTIETVAGKEFLDSVIAKQRTGPRKVKSFVKSLPASPAPIAA